MPIAIDPDTGETVTGVYAQGVIDAKVRILTPVGYLPGLGTTLERALDNQTLENLSRVAGSISQALSDSPHYETISVAVHRDPPGHGLAVLVELRFPEGTAIMRPEEHIALLNGSNIVLLLSAEGGVPDIWITA